MSWRTLTILTSCTLLAATSALSAAEVRLNEAQLDTITAGAVLGNVIGNTGGGGLGSGAIGTVFPPTTSDPAPEPSPTPTPEPSPTPSPSPSIPNVTLPIDTALVQSPQPSATGDGSTTVVDSSTSVVPGVRSLSTSFVSIIQEGPGQTSTGGGSSFSATFPR